MRVFVIAVQSQDATVGFQTIVDEPQSFWGSFDGPDVVIQLFQIAVGIAIKRRKSHCWTNDAQSAIPRLI